MRYSIREQELRVNVLKNTVIPYIISNKCSLTSHRLEKMRCYYANNLNPALKKHGYLDENLKLLKELPQFDDLLKIVREHGYSSRGKELKCYKYTSLPIVSLKQEIIDFDDIIKSIETNVNILRNNGYIINEIVISLPNRKI